MFKMFFKKGKPTKADEEIERLYERMSKISDQNSDEYKDCVQRLDDLVTIDSKKKKSEPQREKINPNTIAVGVFGLLQVGLIIGHEYLHPITTKALGFIMRGRA